MPSGVFKPYAGVSTAILFFTKGESTRKVWFYEMESDGFSLDDKRTRLEKNDIPNILESFENRKKESNEDRSKKHFFVPLEEIQKEEYNLSFSTYEKKVFEEQTYEKPGTYIKKLEKMEDEIVKGIADLKKLV